MAEACGAEPPEGVLVGPCINEGPCYTPELHHDGKAFWWPSEAPRPPKRSSKAKLDEMASTSEREHRVGPPTLDEVSGQRKAYEATSAEFKEEALRSIHYVAQHRHTLTVDDVWADLTRNGIETQHRTSIGTLMKQAQRQGWIEWTEDMVRATGRLDGDQRIKNGGAHGLTVWKSLVCVTQ